MCCEIMLSGASGQMGQAIEALAERDDALRVVARFDRHSGFADQPLGQVIIDVSHHSQAPQVVAFARRHHLPLVIGTTALSGQTQQDIAAAATEIAICQASNFSIGATVLGRLAQLAAMHLPNAKIHIDDTHHVHKQDAPSGTALTLRDLIASVNNGQDVEISSHREGEVIGTHEVCFSSADEVLTLRHEAKDRRVFAQGAVRAAQRLCGREPGLFSLAELLGLVADG
jgi:4-hydroxy-tetrahydrodipicolinate reductase